MESYNKHSLRHICPYHFCRKKDGLDEMQGLMLFYLCDNSVING